MFKTNQAIQFKICFKNQHVLLYAKLNKNLEGHEIVYLNTFYTVKSALSDTSNRSVLK